MKLITTLTAFTLTSVLAAAAASQQDRENKEQLAQVSRIYVSGEGPSIEKVRDRIGRAKGCFILTENSNDSDAILYVGVPGGGSRSVAVRASADDIQGELKTKDGNKIWSTGSTVVNSTNHDTAVGLAIVSLVNSLEKDAGCGKRKGALAKGQDSGK
jgi:hypothetical protein